MNVYVVLYEALCASPETLARRIMAFAGLDWSRQTADFVARSTTHQGAVGYYTILRDTAAVADFGEKRWPSADQEAVRSVVAVSPLRCDSGPTSQFQRSDNHVTISGRAATLFTECTGSTEGKARHRDRA